MQRLNKTLNFLDFMIRVVFVSTFIFTGIILTFAFIKDWESLANTVTDKWFNVMVSELVVTGVIQISKKVTETILKLNKIIKYLKLKIELTEDMNYKQIYEEVLNEIEKEDYSEN